MARERIVNFSDKRNCPTCGNRRNKFPLDDLATGESFLLLGAGPSVRGRLYNNAEALGIRVTVRQDGEAIRVRRVA